MPRMFFAHSTARKDRPDRQMPPDHLIAVAALAAERGESCRIVDAQVGHRANRRRYLWSHLARQSAISETIELRPLFLAYQTPVQPKVSGTGSLEMALLVVGGIR